MKKSIVILIILFQVSFSFARNNKSWFDMDSSQLEVVKAAYYQNTETAVNARAILALTKGLKYMRYPYDLEGGDRRSIHVGKNNATNNTVSKLAIYPNPANDEMTIILGFTNINNYSYLQIINAQGLKIKEWNSTANAIEKLQTKNLDAGLYFLLQVSDNKVVDKIKFIVSH